MNEGENMRKWNFSRMKGLLIAAFAGILLIAVSAFADVGMYTGKQIAEVVKATSEALPSLGDVVLVKASGELRDGAIGGGNTTDKSHGFLACSTRLCMYSVDLKPTNEGAKVNDDASLLLHSVKAALPGGSADPGSKVTTC